MISIISEQKETKPNCKESSSSSSSSGSGMSSSDELLPPPSKKPKLLASTGNKPDFWGVTHVRTHKCTYLWEIHNYNVCSKKNGEALESPLFGFKNNDKYQWRLRLYPKGISEKNEAEVVMILDLKSKPEGSPEELEVEYEFALVDATGQPRQRVKSVNWFNTKLGKGQLIVARRALHEQAAELLPNNALTVLCRITAGTGGCLGISRVPIADCAGQAGLSISLPHKWQSDTLQLMYGEAKYSDITFIADGQKFPAHKAVIAARSSTFAALLDKVPAPYGMCSIVEIKDVKKDIFGEILRFIYTAKISDPKTITNDLLAAADRFCLPELKQRCEIMLSNSLNIESVVKSLVFADQHEASHLKASSIDFIISNAKDVIETPAYKQIVASNPKLIVEVFHSMALKQES